MIIVLFGQPGSGKTVLSKKLQKHFTLKNIDIINVDGDEIRRIFSDYTYDVNSRIRNLKRISEIAKYLSEYHDIVTVSAVFPLLEAREYLKSLSNDILWVYLTFDGVRGREDFSVSYFEIPDLECDDIIHINTSELNIEQSYLKIIDFYNLKCNILNK